MIERDISTVVNPATPSMSPSCAHEEALRVEKTTCGMGVDS
jgi:hypothetical protein